MPEKNKSLYLFTRDYPNGAGEPFVENELPYIAPLFKKVYIFPQSDKKQLIKIPDNAVIINDISNVGDYSSKKIFVKNLFLILFVYLLELLKSDRKIIFIRHIREYNSLFCKSILIANKIQKEIANQTIVNSIFYSFWMNEWATALAILRYRKKINYYVFRVNGYDLYEEQTRWNYIPFRPFNIKMSTKMFAISNPGCQYLKSKNIYPEKIYPGFFATNDHGLNPFDKKTIFTIVSCAKTRPIKGIHLIPQVLKYISIPIKWIHIGGFAHANYKTIVEAEINELKKSKKDIEIDFKGELSQEEIVSFYKNQHCNLFVSFSLSEGLPLSIIEAISYGIPILATNVGGVSDIVTDNTGILLEKKFDFKIVADIISNFSSGKLNTPEFREGVKKYWATNFEASKYYLKFFHEITMN